MQYVLCSKMLRIAACLSLLAFAGMLLYAQASGGAISGTVTDKTGAAVADTKVTATNEVTTISQLVTTNTLISRFYQLQPLAMKTA